MRSGRRSQTPTASQKIKREEEKSMKLYDLNGIINFDFDIADNEIDASFYIELVEINPKYAKQIEVVKIDNNLIICKLTDFLRNHKTAIKKYLSNNYYEGQQLNYLMEILISNDITADYGEAVYHFINYDLYDFLTQN